MRLCSKYLECFQTKIFEEDAHKKFLFTGFAIFNFPSYTRSTLCDIGCTVMPVLVTAFTNNFYPQKISKNLLELFIQAIIQKDNDVKLKLYRPKHWIR